MMIHDTLRFQTGKNSSNVYQVVGSLLNIPSRTIDRETVKYYFNHKKNDEYGWCRNAQWRTLAILYDVIICVIVKQDENYRTNVIVKLYGENSSVDKQCICMYFDENASDYYSLFIIDDAITKMTYDDSLKECIRSYIKDEINYQGDVYFDETELINVLAPLENEQPNEHEIIPDSILMSESTKRKLADIDEILPALNDDRQLPNENPEEVPNKRLKVNEDVSGRMPLSRKSRFEIKEMEGLIQAERIHNESDSDDTNEDEQTNSPITSLDEYHEEKAHDDQCNEDFCSTNSDLF